MGWMAYPPFCHFLLQFQIKVKWKIHNMRHPYWKTNQNEFEIQQQCPKAWTYANLRRPKKGNNRILMNYNTLETRDEFLFLWQNRVINLFQKKKLNNIKNCVALQNSLFPNALSIIIPLTCSKILNWIRINILWFIVSWSCLILRIWVMQMTPKCTSIAATPPICPKEQQQTNHNCSYYCGLCCPEQHQHHCHNCYCHCCYGPFGSYRRIAALSYNDTIYTKSDNL